MVNDLKMHFWISEWRSKYISFLTNPQSYSQKLQLALIWNLSWKQMKAQIEARSFNYVYFEQVHLKWSRSWAPLKIVAKIILYPTFWTTFFSNNCSYDFRMFVYLGLVYVISFSLPTSACWPTNLLGSFIVKFHSCYTHVYLREECLALESWKTHTISFKFVKLHDEYIRFLFSLGSL